MSTLTRNLSWQDQAKCLGLIHIPFARDTEDGDLYMWGELRHAQQIKVCNSPCPVRALCRQFNDDMQSSGIVAGGRWYPVSGMR